LKFAKIGDHVIKGDPLMVVEDTGDGFANQMLSTLDDDENEEIANLTRQRKGYVTSFASKIPFANLLHLIISPCYLYCTPV